MLHEVDLISEWASASRKLLVDLNGVAHTRFLPRNVPAGWAGWMGGRLQLTETNLAIRDWKSQPRRNWVGRLASETTRGSDSESSYYTDSLSSTPSVACATAYKSGSSIDPFDRYKPPPFDYESNWI